MDGGRIPIRSYRLCFELERRIHRVDRWRIPVPYGVPLRGIAYAASALMVILVCQGLPLIGLLIGGLHPALRLVIAPVGIAYALCMLTVDGRPAHAAGLAWLRHRLAPARVAAFRAVAAPGLERLGDVTLSPDGLAAAYCPGVVRGPASVLLRYPARAEQRRRTLSIRGAGRRPMWNGRRVRLAAGQRLVVR